MRKLKAIIFDFDGVIAESVDVKTEAFAELYKGYGKEIQNKVIAHHLAHGGVSRFEKFRHYHGQFLHRNITDREMQALSEEFSRLVLTKVIQAPFVKGAYSFITTRGGDFDMFISSGTPEEEIRKIIQARGLAAFFKDIYGSPDQKSKHVKRIISASEYHRDEVVFIGDALSDREAAEENGIAFIARVTPTSLLRNERYAIPDLTQLTNMLELIEHA
jgi:phosphoglycolate phosphatase-like HAD superfamily hydrolase